jgi:hypothetical protein
MSDRDEAIKDLNEGNLEIQKRLKELIATTDDPKIKEQAESNSKPLSAHEAGFQKRRPRRSRRIGV